MRNPEVSVALPQRRGGAVDVARGKASLQQAVLTEKTTALSGAAVAGIGGRGGDGRIAYSEAMNMIMNELRRHFDMIIVDALPLAALRREPGAQRRSRRTDCAGGRLGSDARDLVVRSRRSAVADQGSRDRRGSDLRRSPQAAARLRLLPERGLRQTLSRQEETKRRWERKT